MRRPFIIASGVIVLALASFAALAGVGWLGSASAGGGNFTADLTGAAERPTPVVTDVVGKAEIEFSEDLSSASFELEVENAFFGTPNRKLTQAHIHCGGPEVAGPVVVFLAGNHANGWEVDGLWVSNASFTADNIVNNSCGSTMSALRDSIAAGNTYVNVHSVANPGGEARGQLQAD
jgi:CHRD domain